MHDRSLGSGPSARSGLRGGDHLRATLRLSAFLAVLLVALLATLAVRALLAAFAPERGVSSGVSALHHFMRVSARILGVELEVRGPLPIPGSLIVANHRSYLDAVALGALVPTTFLAKREVASWPLLGLGARVASIAFVDRGDGSSRRAATEELTHRLRQGVTVVNFPEGTTSDAREPLPFRTGLFGRLAGSEHRLVAARLDYDDPRACWTGDATFVDHLYRVAASPRTRIFVRFSPPVEARLELDGEALRDRCWTLVADQFSESLHG
jgi:1-acyl-sn-glycerol-3-phosphate acyltransferase